jgi:hypothetical protein
VTDDQYADAEGLELEQEAESILHPGEAKLADGPTYLDGRSKLYGATIVFLWSTLVGFGGWAVGDRNSALRLQAHSETPGHPILVERVGSLEQRILDRLNLIDARLQRMEDDR